MVKILSDIQYSGSRGNITFGHNKGGQYMRSRAIPVNPNSARQQATRNILGTYAAGWNALSDAQRALWRSYAAEIPVPDALGQMMFLSGINWYIKCNSILGDAGLTPIDYPPIGSVPAGFATFAVTWTDEDTVSVAFTPVLPSGFAIQLWQTIPGSAGKMPNFNQARLVGYSSADEVTPWSTDVPYPGQTGNSARFFGAVVSDEGLISTKSVSTAVIPA